MRFINPLLLRSLYFAVSLSFSPWLEAAVTKSWSSSYPTTGAVTIPAGETVLLDTDVNLNNLTILGKVICAGKNINIAVGWILVRGGLECGTAVSPYLHRLIITLTGTDSTENIQNLGTKFLGTLDSGFIALHGSNRTSWTRLAQTAAKGARQIKLNAAVDWKVGEKIVIASSDYHPNHAEEAVIKGISGATAVLAQPLKYNHWCQKQTFSPVWSLTECAEAGLFNRNILIQGNASSTLSGFGGHFIVTRGGSAKLSNVEFFRMGQEGLLGRYPVHWHMVGAAPGQYLRNSSIHHSYNRFVSIHGTHQVLLHQNVGYETRGHGFYLEDGIEEGNTVTGNLGLSVHSAEDGKPTASDREASVFWVSNPNNTIRYNVAAGSDHTGFWLGFPEHPIGLSATGAIWPRRTPLKEFNANVSHSNSARGLYVDGGERPDRTTGTTWYEPRSNPADSNSALVTPVFKSFTAYKNRSEGVWIRSFAGPVLTGAKLADNWMGAYFANITAGPLYTNTGIIQNSLVVGETGNKGNPETWESKGLDGRELPHFWAAGDSIRGLEYYDGPMLVRTTLFANFLSNAQRKAGGLSNLAPNPFWVSSRNSSEGNHFVNTNRVYFHNPTAKNNGDAFSAFLDKDGSVSGSAGASIVPKNPVMVTPECVFKAPWNGYVCPHSFVNFRMFLRSPGTLSGTVIKRNDGASLKLFTPDEYPDELNTNLIAARPYVLDFPGGTPGYLSFVVSEKAQKPIRVSMSYPYPAVSVTLWGWPVQKASSLAELTTGGHKYFHDGSRLYLRLVSETGGWEEIEVKR